MLVDCTANDRIASVFFHGHAVVFIAYPDGGLAERGRDAVAMARRLRFFCIALSANPLDGDYISFGMDAYFWFGIDLATRTPGAVETRTSSFAGIDNGDSLSAVLAIFNPTADAWI